MREDLSCDTNSSLLLRVQRDDQAAWREFFEIYTPVVLGYSMRRGLQPNDAEDIAQAVMIEVARCIHAFDYQPSQGRFRDWLGTIAWRRLARFWRVTQRNPFQMICEPPAKGSLDPEWIDQYQSHIMYRALQSVRPRFSATSWQVFQAVWMDGERALSVANRLKIPIEVVYHIKSRFLKQLEIEVKRIADDSAWQSYPIQ